MKKIGVCGFFSFQEEDHGGQPVKTREIYNQLKSNYGDENVFFVDTYHWKKTPLNLLLKCFKLLRNCQVILFLPAHNGVKIFVPLFLMLNKLFHRDLHYVVVGGWLPELLAHNPKLKNKVRKLKGVYVETQVMINALEKLGLDNTVCIPNFKRLDVLKEDELVYPDGEPYKLCTFSRVVKEKGIEDAIEAVKAVNKTVGRVGYCLDIFGQIDDGYRERFEQLKKDFPSFIAYKGVVGFNESVDVLKDYFVLLFPTHFKTEGIPGTILDAYAAGIPIIASNWNSADEIIVQDQTGWVYDFMDNSMLKELLFTALNNPILVNKMKTNCINIAKEYAPETIVGNLVKCL